MDPNTTLRQINDFLAGGSTGEEVDQWCRDLLNWIEGGGFEPDWWAYPLGAGYYECRRVHMLKENAG